MRVMYACACVFVLGGCQLVGGRWVVDEPARVCRGGVINSEKRITDTFVAGRVRNTVIRTDACLD